MAELFNRRLERRAQSAAGTHRSAWSWAASAVVWLFLLPHYYCYLCVSKRRGLPALMFGDRSLNRSVRRGDQPCDPPTLGVGVKYASHLNLVCIRCVYFQSVFASFISLELCHVLVTLDFCPVWQKN